MTPLLQFKPVYQERVWGGRALERALGRKLPPTQPIGESWEVVDRPEAQSIVEGGALNYGRDGAMRFDANGGRAKNYEPNSYHGPAQTGIDEGSGYDVSGSIGRHGLIRHRDDDDFVQAGALYRLMPEDAKVRLIANIAGSLSQVSREDVIERAISNFAKADGEFGKRLRDAVDEKREVKRAVELTV